MVRHIIKKETDIYLLRYRILKTLHSHEHIVRETIKPHQHYFAYLLKTQLTDKQFSTLIQRESLSQSVSLIRDDLVSQVLKFDNFKMIEEEIMFDHPEFQKHTRKDKTKEHGYITLDKYGTETPFEFPMDDINKDSPWYQHCYKFLVEAKGQNITYYRHLRPEADHILVCTCLSRLHIANIAYGLMDIGKGLRRKHVRMEGQPEDDWVCIDSGDTLVHIFTQGDRDYYGIDLLYTVEHPYIDSSSEATG